MINLIDKGVYSELKAARVNIVLRRYVMLFLATLGAVIAALAIGYLLLQSTLTTAQKESENAAAEKEKYSATIKASEAFTKNLTTAKAILASDVPMSNVVTRIGLTLPSGTVLGTLSLSKTALSEPMSFTIKAKDIEDTNRVTRAFRGSPYFSEASIISATIAQGQTAGAGAENYPVDIMLSVKLRADKILGKVAKSDGKRATIVNSGVAFSMSGGEQPKVYTDPKDTRKIQYFETTVEGNRVLADIRPVTDSAQRKDVVCSPSFSASMLGTGHRVCHSLNLLFTGRFIAAGQWYNASVFPFDGTTPIADQDVRAILESIQVEKTP